MFYYFNFVTSLQLVVVFIFPSISKKSYYSVIVNAQMYFVYYYIRYCLQYCMFTATDDYSANVCENELQYWYSDQKHTNEYWNERVVCK